MRVLILLGLIVALGACGPTDEPAVATNEPSIDTHVAHEPEGPAVAEINGQPVSEDLLLAFLRLRNQNAETEAERQQATSQLIDLYLLAQAAEADGLLDRRAVKAELELQRLSWIANRVLAERARMNPISEDAIRAEYEKGLSASGQREYRVRHILVSDRARAESLIAQLDAGMEFVTLEQSLVPELGPSNAGELGWVNSSQVPTGFASAMASLPVGQYTPEPVQTEYGWHVIKVEDARGLSPPPFESVQGNIRATLARRQAEEYLAQLRAAAGIETD